MGKKSSFLSQKEEKNVKIHGESITSRQNRTVIEVGKLTDRKAREAAKRFRFDGIKLLV